MKDLTAGACVYRLSGTKAVAQREWMGAGTLGGCLLSHSAPARISSGKRYSSPALPKFTKISIRPMFSTARTKVPSRGSTTPVFCERIGLLVFNGSPVFMIPLYARRLLNCLAALFKSLDVNTTQTASVLSVCSKSLAEMSKQSLYQKRISWVFGYRLADRAEYSYSLDRAHGKNKRKNQNEFARFFG